MKSRWDPDGLAIEVHLVVDERFHLFQVILTLILLSISIYVFFPLTNPIGFWLPESVAATLFGTAAFCAFVDYLFSATMISVNPTSGQVSYRRFLRTRLWGTVSSIESITAGWGRAYPVSIRIQGRNRKLIFIDSPTNQVLRWATAVAEVANQQGHTVVVEIDPKREIDRFSATGPGCTMSALGVQ